MYCNLRQPDAAQSLSALIRRPWQVWTRWASVAVFRASFSCWYITLHCDLELWPLTLTFDLWPWTCVVDRLRHGLTLYEIWAKSDNSQRSYCCFNIWSYDLEHVSRVALCSGTVCTKFKLRQAIRSWNVTIFFMLIRHVTLWPWPLTP